MFLPRTVPERWPGIRCRESALSSMNLSDGVVRVTVLLKPEVFYRVLSEQTGLEMASKRA